MDADVFLFGSRATGGASEHSDWDIGYRCAAETPRRALVRVEEELEDLPVPTPCHDHRDELGERDVMANEIRTQCPDTVHHPGTLRSSGAVTRRGVYPVSLFAFPRHSMSQCRKKSSLRIRRAGPRAVFVNR
ncbi:nucleotidyltransferase family protein [Deferrisoma camini]|uniref:nucleotidyltransferase family protein n=1 Tax=Deferrisoma camini TaxID=1035120 RepID=UPI0038B2B668